jgi:uncharacterized protein (DUF58 family)
LGVLLDALLGVLLGVLLDVLLAQALLFVFVLFGAFHPDVKLGRELEV